MPSEIGQGAKHKFPYYRPILAYRPKQGLEAISYTPNSVTVNGQQYCELSPFLENVVFPFPDDISSTVASLNLYELVMI